MMSEMHERGRNLLPLRRMAARLGVPSRWLREQAEAGKVPCLRAGNRWLFAPDVTEAAVESMIKVAAEKSAAFLCNQPTDGEATCRIFGSMDHPLVKWMKDKGINVVQQSDQGMLEWSLNMASEGDKDPADPKGGAS